MYDRIIAPIEKEAGPDAVAEASALARGLDCVLTLLHVHHLREAPDELEGLTQYRYQNVVERWDEQDGDAEAREVEWVADLADAMAAADPELRVEGRVVQAPLSRSLRDEGENVLVVVPSRDAGEDGLDRTAREILRAGSVPVLLVPPAAVPYPVRRIMVALDGSEFAATALAPALALARATGARLTLVEVVTRHNGLARLLHATDRSAESAERSLRDTRDRIPPELGPVEIHVAEHGDAAGGILAEARREGVDLVAMATHGRGGLRRLLLGSVAESVVRRSPVPVLLFRPLEFGAGSPGRTMAGFGA